MILRFPGGGGPVSGTPQPPVVLSGSDGRASVSPRWSHSFVGTSCWPRVVMGIGLVVHQDCSLPARETPGCAVAHARWPLAGTFAGSSHRAAGIPGTV